jgi:predicted metalloprotease with PDZ domain
MSTLSALQGLKSRGRPLKGRLAGYFLNVSEALKVPHFVRFLAVAALGVAVPFAAVRAQAAGNVIALRIDTSAAPTQNVVFTHETIPVQPGKLTLYFPKWLPGQHQPVGPIANFAAMTIKAGGAALPWRRQPLDLYAIDVDVPAGANSIDVDATYLGATFGRYASARLATSNMLVITWDQNLVYPSSGTIQNTIFRPTIVLPASNWGYATALPGGRRDGNAVSFDAVSLEHLIDSPLDAGVNYRRWLLWQNGDAAAYLNAFADTPSELRVSDSTIGHYRKLVAEMLAMYGARHWRNYNFLLTMSDAMPGEGIEHHESSDDGGGGDYFTNPKSLDRGGDLLSHEFNHSWDGKYRMPTGLYPPNLQLPYDDSLLWVYEGMTQYYGNVMAWRDGIRSLDTYPDHIAATYADYDTQPGRLWRSVGDTATSGPFIYMAPRGYSAERRGEDFYSESELMWLKADSIIRQQTSDRSSLDTFARAFFGGSDTGPIVVTYDRNDVIAALNTVAPYDWGGFFKTWVDDIAVHPPDGFTADGWKLVYNDTPSHWVPKSNFWYSLGIATNAEGLVTDVRTGSPAWTAGLGIDTTLIAVNGRSYDSGLLYDTLQSAMSNRTPVDLLVRHGDTYRTISIPYYDGPRYPHLVRIVGTADRLTEVVTPKT